MAAFRSRPFWYLLLAALLAMLMSISYAGSATPTLNALRDAPIDIPVRIAQIAVPVAETVCLLQPYQDRSRDGGDLTARINAHLDAEAFAADEGHFTLILVREHGIETMWI